MKRAAFLFLLIFGLAALSCARQGSESLLIGQWEFLEANIPRDLSVDRMEFFNDGTGIQEADSLRGIGRWTDSFSWRIGSDGRLILMSSGVTHIYTIIELSDTKLTMEGNIPMFGHVRSTLVSARTLAQALGKLVGVWEGSYFAGQGETGLTLSVFEERGIFRAIFDFYNLPGKTNAAYGSYYMRISYNPSTGRYSLTGYRWIERPSGWGFADLDGTIAGDVFSGSVVAPGGNWTFQVVRRR